MKRCGEWVCALDELKISAALGTGENAQGRSDDAGVEGCEEAGVERSSFIIRQFFNVCQ